jgi:hypothetical protein
MMMKNFRKGQAALEFLTTYGWAFLVILVMIGALGYFGVFDTSRFVPETCKLDGKVECPTVFVDVGNNNFPAAINAGMQMRIQNNLNEDIIVNRVVLAERRNPGLINATGASAPGWTSIGPVTIPDGQELDVNFVFDGTGAPAWVESNLDSEEGEKLSFDLQLFYTVGTSSIQQVATGSLTTVVN